MFCAEFHEGEESVSGIAEAWDSISRSLSLQEIVQKPGGWKSEDSKDSLTYLKDCEDSISVMP